MSTVNTCKGHHLATLWWMVSYIYILLGFSVLWIWSYYFELSIAMLRFFVRSAGLRGFRCLMSNSLTRLCDSNLFDCLIGWWLTGMLSFVDCALILVVVEEVPVVGFLVVVAFRMFVGWELQSSKIMMRVEVFEFVWVDGRWWEYRCVCWRWICPCCARLLWVCGRDVLLLVPVFLSVTSWRSVRSRQHDLPEGI